MCVAVDRIVGPRVVLELEAGEIIEIAGKHLPLGALNGPVICIAMPLGAGRKTCCGKNGIGCGAGSGVSAAATASEGRNKKVIDRYI